MFDEWMPYDDAQLDAIEERNIEVGNALCGGDWKSVISLGKANQSPDTVLGETKWTMLLMMHHAAWAACSASKGSRIVSIGSGTGSMLIGALEMGLFAEAYGCERNANLSGMMRRMSLLPDKFPHLPSIETGVFPKETPATLEAVAGAHAIYVCNQVFTEKNNVKIFKALLQHAAPHAVIVTMQPIPNIDRDLDERRSRVKCFQSIYDEVVTWHNKQQAFYIYYLDSVPARVSVGSIGDAFGGGAFSPTLKDKILAKEEAIRKAQAAKQKKRSASSPTKNPKRAAIEDASSSSSSSSSPPDSRPPSPSFFSKAIMAADAARRDEILTLPIDAFDDDGDSGDKVAAAAVLAVDEDGMFELDEDE